MKIIEISKKTVELVKKRSEIGKKLQEKDSGWFLSSEGEEALRNSKAPSQKTKYFFDYLSVISKNGDRDTLYRIAYIIANSILGSSLEFGKYPQILSPDKNPFVKYAMTVTQNSNLVASGVMLLSLLHGEDASKYIHAEERPYTLLSYCDENSTKSEIYKIEREIIGAFCNEFSGNYIPPYMYDIVSSARSDS